MKQTQQHGKSFNSSVHGHNNTKTNICTPKHVVINSACQGFKYRISDMYHVGVFISTTYQ